MKINLKQRIKAYCLLFGIVTMFLACEKDLVNEQTNPSEQNLIEYGISKQQFLNSKAFEKIQRNINDPILSTTLNRNSDSLSTFSISDISDRIDLDNTYFLSQDNIEVLNAPIKNRGSYKRVLLSLTKNGITQPYLLTYPDSTNHRLYYVSTLDGTLLQKTIIQDDGHGISEVYNSLTLSNSTDSSVLSRNGGEMCTTTVYQSCSSGNHSFEEGDAMECTFWGDLTQGTPPTVTTVPHPCPGGFGESGSDNSGGGSSGGNYDGSGVWTGGGFPNVPPKKGNGSNLDDCIPNIDCEDCNIQGDIDNNCFIDEYETCILAGFPVNTCYDEFQIINELDGKALCVYNKLKSTSTGFKNAIKKFEPEFPVAHLKFEADATMSSNTKKAYTRAPENYVIDIVLNGNPTKDASYQKRPNLLVAKTIIHEVIHAEMFRKLLSLANNNGSIDVSLINQMLLQGDYPGMLDYYFRNGSDINSNWQHQQMAAHYRETIARALQEFDTGISVPDNQQPQQLYLDLSWEGLIYSNITAWQEIMDDTERTRIENVISDYISNNLNQTCTE